MSDDLERLREEIAALDQTMLELLARRFRLTADVGALKAERGQPVVVREVEQRVLSRAREAAARCGVSPEVLRAIFEAIIRGSVERQYRIGVERSAAGSRRVLIVGAAGAMGSWFAAFLESIGHRVEGADPAWADLPRAPGRHGHWNEVPALQGCHAILVAAPLSTTGHVLEELSRADYRGTVIEIASIKSHLRESLDLLAASGKRALSIHPMFGPGKNPYEPLTIVHAASRDEKEERAFLLELLAHPYLDLVSVPFDRHDRLAGWLLGLAHLTGMLFAGALQRSRLDPQELRRVASTTFARQVSTARSVLEEDHALYFSIQRLNPFRGEVYAALGAALGDLTGAVERGDGAAFAEVLAQAAAQLPGMPGR
jgi:chorismate mutase/prephenate dehydrogenase